MFCFIELLLGIEIKLKFLFAWWYAGRCATKGSIMMNQTGGWMGGGMGGWMGGGIWLWTVIGILVGVLLFVVVKMTRK